MRGDDLAERLLEFGARMTRLVDSLPKTFSGKHIASQLFRSATSAGANYEEARGAESKADFIHKTSVVWKEIRESHYWLSLIHRSSLIKPTLIGKLLQEADELRKIFGKSLETARKNKP
jgi:four helix bundle protein